MTLLSLIALFVRVLAAAETVDKVLAFLDTDTKFLNNKADEAPIIILKRGLGE